MSKEYLGWIKDQGLWQQLHDFWNLQTSGPWSLPLFLATGYHEFVETQYPDLGVKESSLSYKRAIVEFSTRSPSLSSRVVGDMAEQIVESFAAWTNTLPEELRLCYQMHLEGLLEHEIAPILGISPSEVASKIKSAKTVLGVNNGEAV